MERHTTVKLWCGKTHDCETQLSCENVCKTHLVKNADIFLVEFKKEWNEIGDKCKPPFFINKNALLNL